MAKFDKCKSQKLHLLPYFTSEPLPHPLPPPFPHPLHLPPSSFPHPYTPFLPLPSLPSTPPPLISWGTYTWSQNVQGSFSEWSNGPLTLIQLFYLCNLWFVTKSSFCSFTTQREILKVWNYFQHKIRRWPRSGEGGYSFQWIKGGTSLKTLWSSIGGRV